jgi:hypothetical protein
MPRDWKREESPRQIYDRSNLDNPVKKKKGKENGKGKKKKRKEKTETFCGMMLCSDAMPIFLLQQRKSVYVCVWFAS